MRKYYRIFISHSWSYDNNYKLIIDLIEKNGLIFFEHSVQEIDLPQINATDDDVNEAIEHHMLGANCILILSSFYLAYKNRIDKEIEIAKRHHKPIIAVEPLDYKKTAQAVRDSADRIVALQGTLIVNTIKQLG